MYSRAFKEEAIDYSETHKSVASSFAATAYTTLAGVKTRSAEKSDDRGERFFVDLDREERRYLFRTRSSEIESN